MQPTHTTRLRSAMIAALLTAASFAGLGGGDAAAQDPPPRTGFEQRNGSSWTTHAEELAFLSEVDRRSDRVEPVSYTHLTLPTNREV